MIALISHASKGILKILHARLQHYVNEELPDIQAGFRKGTGTRDQFTNIRWIIEKAREFQKNIYLCFIDYTKAFDCVDHNKPWKTLKRDGNTRPSYLSPEKPAGQEAAVRILYETLTGSGLRKEDDRAVCCHPVYLTYTLSTSREMLGWLSYKLESR